MTTISVSDHPKGALLWMSSLQWLAFMIATSITVPIVLAESMGMSLTDTSLYIGRTLFVCGLIAMLQAFFGHRLPIVEGPSGLWWGVFLVVITTTQQVGGNLTLMQRDLEYGLIVSGIVVVGLVLIRVIGRLIKLFNPVVTGTYLVLLTLQMSKSILDGILGIGYNGHSSVDWHIALTSLVVIVLMGVLSFKARGSVRSLTILIGLVVGWVISAVFRLSKFQMPRTQVFSIPRVFPFGTPHFQLGIVITCVITVLILLSNVIASLNAFESVLGNPLSESTRPLGTMITGLGTIVSGILGIVGTVPVSGSAGFVALTRIASRRPFLIAGGVLMLFGVFPVLDLAAANLPTPLAYSALFIVFVEMLGIGIKMLREGVRTEWDRLSCGIAILAGVGTQFIPPSAWGTANDMSYLLSNGLVVGVILILIFQNVLPSRMRPESVD